MAQQLNNVLQDIHTAEIQNKKDPSIPLTNKLKSLRETLRNILSQQFDTHLRRLKLNHYANANRAGKYLENGLKAARIKTRIAYLKHPTLPHKIMNPQDIANQFAEYYSSLYNLHSDPNIQQPAVGKIESFLQNINLPTLSEHQLEILNAPITVWINRTDNKHTS